VDQQKRPKWIVYSGATSLILSFYFGNDHKCHRENSASEVEIVPLFLVLGLCYFKVIEDEAERLVLTKKLVRLELRL